MRELCMNRDYKESPLIDLTDLGIPFVYVIKNCTTILLVRKASAEFVNFLPYLRA